MTSGVNDPLVLVDVRGVGKRFGAVLALGRVDLQLRRGECVGLVGHNGAGKSTMVNVLCGALTPDQGELRIGGLAPGAAWGVREAQRWGLRCVFQELSLCGNLTLAENMHMAQPQHGGWSWRNGAGARLMASLDLVFPGHGMRADDIVDELPIGKRQMVEVARAFTPGALPLELVILDEPTSSLDGQAAAQLLAYVRAFVAAGKTCVLITHKLREILAVTDRLIVMRDGQVVEAMPTAEADHERVVAAMGHEVVGTVTAPAEAMRSSNSTSSSTAPAVVIQVTPPTGGGLPLRVRKGEIIGLAGLAGHGQTSLLLRLQGSADAVDGTQVEVHGQTAFVAGDRQADGVFPLWSIARNMTVSWLTQLRHRGLIDLRQEQQKAQQWRQRLGLVTPDLELPIGSLSGGNQQKVLFARALGSSASIILMDDPMRGVDIGTKRDVYALVKEEARAGRSFVWYTTEFDELLHCDRVYVFNNGHVVGELAAGQVTEDRVVAMSFEECIS
jgi:ribose transport system ATP-binding protein